MGCNVAAHICEAAICKVAVLATCKRYLDVNSLMQLVTCSLQMCMTDSAAFCMEYITALQSVQVPLINRTALSDTLKVISFNSSEVEDARGNHLYLS